MSLEVSGFSGIPTDMNDVRVTGFAGILDVFRNSDLSFTVNRPQIPQSPQDPQSSGGGGGDFPILPVLLGLLVAGGAMVVALK
jgi:hypothetical protein